MVATATAPLWDEERRDREFVLGLDLGQAADYSALAILEKFQHPIPKIDPETGDHLLEPRYEVRFLRRYPLGTAYYDVVKNVAALMHSQELVQLKKVQDRHGSWRQKLMTPALVVDGTGCGRPVVDEFRKAGLSPIGVSITGGDQVTRDGLYWYVPKRNLVSQLQIVFQNRTLKIAPSLPLASTLATELQNFKRKIDLRTAHDSYEHWRDSDHDDLVLGTALAFWHAEGRHQKRGGTFRTKGHLF
jgi:hypothetical protein